MNLLILLKDEIIPSRGGVERVTSVLSPYFIAQGIQLAYLYYGIDRITNTEIHRGINVHFLPNRIPVRSKQNEQFLIGLIQSENIDILINQGGVLFDISTLLPAVKSACPVKIVSVLHTNPYNFSLYNRIFRNSLADFHSAGKAKQKLTRLFPGVFARKEFLRYRRNIRVSAEHSDSLVLLSDQYKSGIRELLKGSKKCRIDCIPNPLSFEIEYAAKPKKKQVLFVGRLEYSAKRLDRLLLVWQMIEQGGTDWNLVIAGGSSSESAGDYQNIESDRLKKLAQELSLKNVEFAGNINPQPLYEECRIFCLTSEYEGFPVVLGEAMQYGLVPVVFGSFDAAADIIDHEKNGIIVSPFNLGEYAAQLRILMLNDAWRDNLAKGAVEKSKQFRLDTIGPKWTTLFSELLNA
jgi:glycosyltransferase involved in cell wall biosynthesis